MIVFIPFMLNSSIFEISSSIKDSCFSLRKGETKCLIIFILIPNSDKNATASKSLCLTDGNMKEPVSSYMPRAMIVASIEVNATCFFFKSSVSIVVFEP